MIQKYNFWSHEVVIKVKARPVAMGYYSVKKSLHNMLFFLIDKLWAAEIYTLTIILWLLCYGVELKLGDSANVHFLSMFSGHIPYPFLF